MAFAIFYFFYTPPADFCEIFAARILPSGITFRPLEVHCECRRDNRLLLVFLLLGYLVYALINAEASDGCARVLTDRHVFTGVNGAARPLGSGLARLINDIPLPGKRALSAYFFAHLASLTVR